ncbi:PHP domain-containing protein [Thermanaerothrix sp.]|jgi:predicted metal-dependent phosphoesterase TrpH|uniref:PHP domain-containing protein n=1 Tax=Thermanaerothrix sp. TaxID=2972675 RepID=UPI002ADE58E4|nr:PHP-associated domain-containing protein [Thermanaerothrix sp.]
MGYADLHIHTVYSYDGTSSVEAVLKYVAEYTDLSVIAITDHDCITGALKAQDLAPAYGIEVVPGIEVSTAEGHVLALYIDRPIPPGLSLIETALRVGEQGGLCIAAHPMAAGTSSLDFQTICAALEHPEVRRILVGVERFNGGLVYTRRNPWVEAVASTLPLAQVGNSDAHVLRMIGQGATFFPGNTAAELRHALEHATTEVRKGHGLGGVEVLRDFIPRYILRKMGWVVHNSDPRAPLRLTRVSQALQNTTLGSMPGVRL